ncbi:MAG: hypothetical protein AB7L84_14895 [Acidimicrobiia bacterium]
MADELLLKTVTATNIDDSDVVTLTIELSRQTSLAEDEALRHLTMPPGVFSVDMSDGQLRVEVLDEASIKVAINWLFGSNGLDAAVKAAGDRSVRLTRIRQGAQQLIDNHPRTL